MRCLSMIVVLLICSISEYILFFCLEYSSIFSRAYSIWPIRILFSPLHFAALWNCRISLPSLTSLSLSYCSFYCEELWSFFRTIECLEVEQWEMRWSENGERKLLAIPGHIPNCTIRRQAGTQIEITKYATLKTSTSLDTSRTFLSVKNSMLIELPHRSVWALGCFRLHYPQWVSGKIMKMKDFFLLAFPRVVAVHKSAVQAAQAPLWIAQGYVLYEYAYYKNLLR